MLLSTIAISNESILPPFSFYSIFAAPNMSQLMYTRKLTVISGLFNQGGQSTTNYRVANFLSSMAEKMLNKQYSKLISRMCTCFNYCQLAFIGDLAGDIQANGKSKGARDE